jgi:hypothetical protein
MEHQGLHYFTPNPATESGIGKTTQPWVWSRAAWSVVRHAGAERRRRAGDVLDLIASTIWLPAIRCYGPPPIGGLGAAGPSPPPRG